MYDFQLEIPVFLASARTNDRLFFQTLGLTLCVCLGLAAWYEGKEKLSSKQIRVEKLKRSEAQELREKISKANSLIDQKSEELLSFSSQVPNQDSQKYSFNLPHSYSNGAELW